MGGNAHSRKFTAGNGVNRKFGTGKKIGVDGKQSLKERRGILEPIKGEVRLICESNRVPHNNGDLDAVNARIIPLLISDVKSWKLIGVIRETM